MRLIRSSLAAALIASAAALQSAAARSDLRPAADTLPRSGGLVHMAGMDVGPGTLFRTHEFFKGANAGEKPLGKTLSVHLKYAFRFGPDTRFGRNYPFAHQGVGLSFNSFFNSAEIGTPLSLYVFQHARIAALTERLSLAYEWNFGAAFGWKPFDEQTNPLNTVVGSQINAYIHLGLRLDWCFAPQWHLTAGVGLTHFSNGNTRYPNAGVNLLAGRIGVMRTFGPEAAAERKTLRRSDPFRPYVSCDVVLYGALRKKGFVLPEQTYLIPGSFAVAGLNINPLYNFNRFFRAGLSLDAQYDESANLKDHIANDHHGAPELKFHRPPFREQFSAGLSVRAEIVMPIFSINLGFGKNLIGRGDDTNSYYQIFALKADVGRNLFLHVGYQLYKFRNPNNLMLGLGYRFNGR